MKKQLLLVLFLGLNGTVQSMEWVNAVKKWWQGSPDKQLDNAIQKGDLVSVQNAIKAGAAVTAVEYESKGVVYKGPMPLWRAVFQGDLAIVANVLTGISDADAEQIKKRFEVAWLALKPLTKDVRSIMVQKIVRDLIEERMQRTNQMLEAVHGGEGLSAQEMTVIAFKNLEALHQGFESQIDIKPIASTFLLIADLTDPNNSKVQMLLRAIISNKIKQILFGEPKASQSESFNLIEKVED